jgi:hypothetical protein
MYAQKGGTSSLPPFSMRFRGYEKTKRNHRHRKVWEGLFNGYFENVIHNFRALWRRFVTVAFLSKGAHRDAVIVPLP